MLRNFSGYRELNINGESTAYTGFEDIVIHKLLAHLPLLFHPDPQNILVVGFGFGSTLWSSTRYGLPQADCVELVPDEIETARYFYPENHGVLDSARVRIIFDDGRNLILTSKGKYDVISFNAIHPKLSPMLYTLDFYRLCREAMTPQGTICAWLPTNGLSLTELKSIIRSFAEVFPHSTLWYCNPANLILLGTSEPFTIDWPEYRRRLADPLIAADLREIRLDDPYALASLFMMGEERLRREVAAAPLNTDARPLVEFSRTMAPNVPLASCHWLLNNLETAAGALSWEGGAPPADTLAALGRELERWHRARRTLYQGKFAAWVFQEPNTAMGLYRQAQAQNPADSYIAYFLEGEGWDPDSLKREAAADPENFVASYMLGDHYFRLGQLQEAKRWFARVTAIRPDHAQGWFQLGLCADGLESPLEAEAFFRKALEIHPGSPQAMLNLGVIHYRRQDYDTAREQFEAVLRVSPNDPHALFNLGNVAMRRGDLRQAVELYRRTIEQDPFKVEAWVNLGAMLDKGGDLQQAAQCYDRAIQLAPGYLPAYVNLALTYEKLGDSPRAERYRALAEQLRQGR